MWKCGSFANSNVANSNSVAFGLVKHRLEAYLRRAYGTTMTVSLLLAPAAMRYKFPARTCLSLLPATSARWRTTPAGVGRAADIW